MKRVVIELIFFLSAVLVYSQTFEEEAFRYWYYRDRLRYFVFPGTEDGTSVLMTVRNCNGDNGSVRPYDGSEWGQTRKMNGYYIGLLATEYKLLKDNGQNSDAAVTLHELDLALDALIRMDECEDIEPWYKSYETHDGFFMRSDVPPVLSNNMIECLNFGLTSGSYSEYIANCLDYPGKPFAIDPNVVLTPRKYESSLNYYYSHPLDGFSNISLQYSPTGIDSNLYWNYWKSDKFTSNDEIVGTFMGLALVSDCVDDISVKNKAILIAYKLCIFAMGQSAFLFYMQFPDGERITAQNGGFSGGVIYGLSKCVGHMMGTGSLFGDEGIFDYLVGLSSAESPISCDGDKSMYSKLVAISDASGIHSVLYSLANIGGLYRWQTFYQLLWAVLYDKELTKKKYQYPFPLLIGDLLSAPCGGPYHRNIGTNSYPAGWACQYKYDASLNGQYGHDFERTGVFPGVDYMLLYNLACLAFPNGFDYDGQHYSFPPYVNQNNRNISFYYPIYFPFGGGVEFGSSANPEEIKAISTIETDMIVSNEALFPLNGHYLPGYNGDVTLKAGESIKLTDGFRVDAGAHFLARIESYSCGGVSYKSTYAPPWDENYRGCYYDSLISVPMDQRAPIVYSDDNYEEDDFDLPLWNDYYYTYDTTATTELAVGAWINPNPCGNSATLTVVSENEQQLTIDLYDMTGVKRETVFNDLADLNLSLNLNLSSYASGSYMLRITGSGGVKVLRFVKE